MGTPTDLRTFQMFRPRFVRHPYLLNRPQYWAAKDWLADSWPARVLKAARPTFRRDPSRARRLFGHHVGAHRAQRAQQSLLELRRERHAVAHAAGEHHDAVRGPDAVRLLDEQAL